MSDKPQFYSYEGWGTLVKKTNHFSQTVRIGNILKISGQGGWVTSATSFDNLNIPDDVDAQIDQTFVNVDVALKHAGGKGWSQVYSIRTLHTDLDDNATAAVTRNLRKWCPDDPPLWTEIGVARLGAPGMKVEIEVEAYDG